MAGSIRAKGDNTWQLRVYLGRDSEGRVRHLNQTFHGSRRAAERELARLVAVHDLEPQAPPELQARQWGPATTINDAIAGWRENGWEDLSPKTVRNYQSTWDNHIAPAIGRRRIATLSTFDVEKFLRSLKASGLGRESVHRVRVMLNHSCALARKWSGGVLPNPVTEASMPAWPLEARGHVRAPEPDEVLALLKAAAAGSFDIRFSVFVRLAAATGLRRGEACALRWSSVDFGTGAIRVDEAVVTGAGGATVKSPKTRASMRTLALDSGTVRELQCLRDEQIGLASACQLGLEPEAFVFSFEPGGTSPPHPDYMSHQFSRLRRAAGIASEIHLHSLRHFQATILDPVISERQKQARMGWSTVHMARHYTDAIGAEDRKAAEHVGAFFDSIQS